MALLAPWFIGGLALLAIPYLIHKIRRPEGERVKFSSVMFIPKVRREVIERRRIQHILLMLLRMLALAALALAFARPALRATPDPGVAGRRGRVMVLIDRSYSMGYGARLARAKERAEAVIKGLSPEDRVGVIAFDAAPEMLARLAPPEGSGNETDESAVFAGDAAPGSPAGSATAKSDMDSGSREAALEAVKLVSLTERATAYDAAMRLAQDELLAAREKVDNRPDRLMIYLISDFQRSGVGDRPAWRLSPEIEFAAEDVAGDEAPRNLALSEINLRKTSDGRLRVVGQVKNWSESDELSTDVALMIDGVEIEKHPLVVKPGAATQVSFIRPLDEHATISGWLQIGPDDLELDNRRYFVWSPPLRKNLVLLSAENEPGQYPASFFLSRALPNAPDLPWRVEQTKPDGVAGAIEGKAQPPDLVIAGDPGALTEPVAAALRNYVEGGGSTLLILGGSGPLGAPVQVLLKAAGVGDVGLRFETSGESFAMLSWIDFTHPVFAPFQGSRLNDFSQIRFTNFRRLDAGQSPNASNPSAADSAAASSTAASSSSPGAPRVVARFEPDDAGAEPPAIVEAPLGKGRLVIWPFGLALEDGNLAKSVKFLPLLQETITYLTGARDTRRAWSVGQVYDGRPEALDAAPIWTLAVPGAEAAELKLSAIASWPMPALARSGLLSWTAAGAAAPALVEAVNIDAAESDTRRMTASEFEARMISSTLASDKSGEEVVDHQGRKLRVKTEYWRWMLGFFMVGAAMESLIASRIRR